MDNSVTRISDLPIDNSILSSSQKPTLQTSPTTYTTINPHPNPYGHPPPSVPAPPAPEFQGNNGGGYVYPPSQPQPPQQPLPSRDFPKNQDFYNLDEKIQANYIPPSPPLNTSFMQKYEEEKQKEWIRNVEKKKRSIRIEDVIEKTQIPFIVAILFFIFQLRIINEYLFKYFTFLDIYNIDGNLKIQGLILKSVFFGIVFYVFTYVVDILSSI